MSLFDSSYSEGDSEDAIMPLPLRRLKRARDIPNGEEKMVCMRRDPHVSESIPFHDAIFSNPVFFQTLRAEDILRTSLVSKTWAAWIDDSITNIIDARSHDESRDWHFPLVLTTTFKVDQERPPTSAPRMLHGIWHASADSSANSELCKLPPLPPTPQTAFYCYCGRKAKKVKSVIRASAGGLLLVETTIASTWCLAGDKWDCRYKCCCIWPSLMVTNPLTKELKVLPKPSQPFANWVECSPHYEMMVDENATSYKVMVYRCSKSSGANRARSQLAVYNSTTTKWIIFYHLFHQSLIGQWTNSSPSVIYSTACRSGYIYLADIRKVDTNIDPPLVTGVVRLFQEKINTGKRILPIELPLRKVYNSSMRFHWNDESDTTHMLRNLELVECMGCLHVVIPARLDEYLLRYNRELPNRQEDMITLTEKYMPLQFFIFNLEGRGHGKLRIEVPVGRKNCKYVARRRSLMRKTVISNQDKWTSGENWFSCTAKGSIIWVSIEDYLLQYDVMSCKSTTEILPLGDQFKNEQIRGVAYRGNFCMKP